MAREIGEGLEFDPKDAKKWSKEDFEANATYLLDRGGDVQGTTENEMLVEAVTKRAGKGKAEAALADVYQRRYDAVSVSDEDDDSEEQAAQLAADTMPEEEPAPAKGGKK